MTFAPAARPDHESLCRDVLIGSIGHFVGPFWLPTYLSLDVDFHWRDGNYWAAVMDGDTRWRLRGPMLELCIQVRVRPHTRLRKPRQFTDLAAFGEPSTAWTPDVFRPGPGVFASDVARLATLAQSYNRNLRADAPTDAVLIPLGVVREIRQIAARLVLWSRSGPVTGR